MKVPINFVEVGKPFQPGEVYSGLISGTTRSGKTTMPPEMWKRFREAKTEDEKRMIYDAWHGKGRYMSMLLSAEMEGKLDVDWPVLKDEEK
jgi:hypothetical protein